MWKTLFIVVLLDFLFFWQKIEAVVEKWKNLVENAAQTVD